MRRPFVVAGRAATCNAQRWLSSVGARMNATEIMQRARCSLQHRNPTCAAARQCCPVCAYIPTYVCADTSLWMGVYLRTHLPTFIPTS
jgi:hypothetical protein